MSLTEGLKEKYEIHMEIMEEVKKVFVNFR